MSMEHTLWGFSLRGISPAAKLLAIRIGECCTVESSVRIDIAAACEWACLSDAQFNYALAELAQRGVDYGDRRDGYVFVQIPVKRHDFSAPSKPKDASGALYVVTGDGKTKIGISRQPEERISSLQTGVPFRLSLAFTLEDQSIRRLLAIEQETHRRLASQRLSGEWFSISAFDAFEMVKKVDAETPR